jgi:protein-L-isoaspartate(D-aspartate) O-methyltransferase
MRAVSLPAETVRERLRELSTLEVDDGHDRAWWTAAPSRGLLAQLVGPHGSVTSLDLDTYLSRWANLIRQERGLDNVRCHAADGTVGFPERARRHRSTRWWVVHPATTAKGVGGPGQ